MFVRRHHLSAGRKKIDEKKHPVTHTQIAKHYKRRFDFILLSPSLHRLKLTPIKYWVFFFLFFNSTCYCMANNCVSWPWQNVVNFHRFPTQISISIQWNVVKDFFFVLFVVIRCAVLTSESIETVVNAILIWCMIFHYLWIRSKYIYILFFYAIHQFQRKWQFFRKKFHLFLKRSTWMHRL